MEYLTPSLDIKRIFTCLKKIKSRGQKTGPESKNCQAVPNVRLSSSNTYHPENVAYSRSCGERNAKPDYKQVGEEEIPYAFTGPQALLDDFWTT